MKTIELVLLSVLLWVVRPSFVLAQPSPSTLSLAAPEEFGEGMELGGVNVIRTGPTTARLEVELRITAGGGPGGSAAARPGIDFEVPDPKATFLPGEQVAGWQFRLPPADGFPEPDRYFTVEVVNLPAGFTPGEYGIKRVIRLADDDRELPTHLNVTHDPLQHPMIQFRYDNVPEGDTRFESSAVMTYFPLSNGRKLVLGRFTHVNGVRHSYLARLDENDELDPGFNPTVQLPIGDFLPISSVVPLPSGKTLLIESGRVRRLNPDGEDDPSFQVQPEAFAQAVAPAPDGTLWVVSEPSIDFVLSHHSEEGRLLASRKLGRLKVREREGSLYVQSNGHVLVSGVEEEIDPSTVNTTSRTVVRRFVPDGNDDPGFKPIFGRLLVVLPDERLAVLAEPTRGPDGVELFDLRLFHSDGRVDSNFPPATMSFGWSEILPGVSLDAQGLAFLHESGHSPKGSLHYSSRLLLTGLPKTSLDVSSGQLRI